MRGVRNRKKARTLPMALIAVVAGLSLIFVACGGGGDEAETTTTRPTVTTTQPTTTTTTLAVSEAQDTTTTAAPENGDVAVVIPPYEVVDEGDPLVVVVEPGAYSSVALENLVYDIVENYSPSTAVVVDDPAVVDLLSAEDLDEDQQAQLDRHTFLRIESGVEVTFVGPYEGLEGITVGS